MATNVRSDAHPVRWFARRTSDTQRELAPDDLQIRNLLDDPALRRAMGLDVVVLDEPVAPSQRFDIRRLLHAAAH